MDRTGFSRGDVSLVDIRTIYIAPLAKCALLLPGAAQGATSILIGHPFDTVKTRMQARGPCVGVSSFTTILAMIRHEGWESLYRGVTPPLIMVGIKRSIQFSLWDTLRSDAYHKNSSSHPDTSLQLLKKIIRNPFVSGAIAGAFGTVIGCPLHVIKIQTQNQSRFDTRNSLTCAQRILQLEGFRGLYRGFTYHLLKDICFAGAFLGSYDVLKNLWKGFNENSLVVFLPGAMAAMITWTLLFPLDTLKTLVQAHQEHILAELYANPKKLYRGLSATLIRAGPLSGLTMVVYEIVKRQTDAWIERYSGRIDLP